MRISDWSSDVCSSDLDAGVGRDPGGIGVGGEGGKAVCHRRVQEAEIRAFAIAGRAKCKRRRFGRCDCPQRVTIVSSGGKTDFIAGDDIEGGERRACVWLSERIRSEEHTYELQFIMRNSYAGFCS